MRTTRPGAACGLAGAVLFTVTWVVAGLATPGFSFADNDTSDLGALGAAHAVPYNLGVSLSGLLTLGLAVALVRTFGRRRAAIATAVAVAMFGVGQFIDGFAREDCAASVDALCRAAEKAGRISTHHQVHNIESLFTFTALLAAPLLAAWLWRWSLVPGLVQLVCLPVFLTMYSNGSNGQGLVEIVELTAGVGWIAAVSLMLLSEGAEDGGRLRR